MSPHKCGGANCKQQIDAARNIEARLKLLGLPMTHLVAPKLGHSMPPEWRAKAEAEYAKYAGRERPDYPPKVRFVTPDADRDGHQLLGRLNRRHAESRPGDSRLEARIASYELAARMQQHAPEALDLARESAMTRRRIRW